MNISSLRTLAVQVGKYAKACGVKSILQTKTNAVNLVQDSKNILKIDVSDFAYHGSPCNFDFFDVSKIGTGEGMAKRGIGLYLSTNKRIAPYYSNIRSKDAPLRFGKNGVSPDADPHIYTISGMRNLNLKTVGQLEAKNISKNQKVFEESYPNIDGLIVEDEICVFPKSIDKINIFNKNSLEEFVIKYKDYPFRSWTTDKQRIDRLGLPSHHLE